MRLFASLLLILGLRSVLGCGAGGEAEPPAPPHAEGRVGGPQGGGERTPSPATEPAPVPSGLDTATACERARACCPAFVDAIEDPVEAERARIACEQMEHLAELGEGSGEACLAALDGWRRALELAEREVPAACH
jgi:hypothetical protein